jgi:hypothetical protein
MRSLEDTEQYEDDSLNGDDNQDVRPATANQGQQGVYGRKKAAELSAKKTSPISRQNKKGNSLNFLSAKKDVIDAHYRNNSKDDVEDDYDDDENSDIIVYEAFQSREINDRNSSSRRSNTQTTQNGRLNFSKTAMLSSPNIYSTSDLAKDMKAVRDLRQRLLLPSSSSQSSSSKSKLDTHKLHVPDNDEQLSARHTKSDSQFEASEPYNIQRMNKVESNLSQLAKRLEKFDL